MKNDKDSRKKIVTGLGINKARGSGPVLVVNSYKDFDNVKGGEVVLTANATPDFILILKKIKCLIVNEGSLTCHIAIVCRELGTPAIVATGSATEVFANGEMVTFDTVLSVLESKS